ncbi:hypothetical protein CPB86DRAFT_790138 [Serendipita vermifera]|nr:hypothetical protein CPB86DRAFT_790138 [Serendipita vermifera]
MYTGSLPLTISIFFVASGLIMFVSFVLSMVNLGWYSVYMIPSSVVVTAAHHITLLVLARRKVEPPSIAHALDAKTVNQSPFPVTFPASRTHSNLESAEIPMVVRERHAHTGDTVYPSYTIHAANCTIVFLLACTWASGSWLPFFVRYASEETPTPRNSVTPYLEGCFMICESLLLFWLFALLVYHRKKQLRAKESIPMAR